MQKINIRNKNNGSFLPLLLVISTIGILLITVVSDFALSNLKMGNNYSRKTTSREIAEAGINYYQWHLSHNNIDFRDGQTTPANPPYGPYTHQYKNIQGEVIGEYTLMINPPDANNSYATVTSVGKTTDDNIGITIEATIGIPSFSQYAWVVNDQLYFGEDATTNGKVHSNDGVRFDGTANSLITSAKQTYQYGCTSHEDKPGVWTQDNLGRFNQGYQFPVPAVDFNQITANLQAIKTASKTADGIYLAPSGAEGYELKLKSNPNQIDIYKVTNANQNMIRTTFIRTANYPQNGVVFVEDNLFISGTFNGKMTIAAALLPDPGSSRDRKNITIVDDVLYYNNTYDGTILLGLISQNDITVARFIPRDLTLDGALLAQNGGTGVTFSGTFNNHDLGTLITHGGIASDLAVCNGYGMARYNTRGDIEGFSTRIYNYDPNLYFNPPPMYPTTGSYTILSWKQK